MTVLATTGEAVTLVGRGENIRDDNNHDVVTFLTSDGRKCILLSDNDTSQCFIIEGGQILKVDSVILPAESYDIIINVDYTSGVISDPRALIFAHSCGLDVSILELQMPGLFIESIGCDNDYFILTANSTEYCVFTDGSGQQGQYTGLINCALDNVLGFDDRPVDLEIEMAYYDGNMPEDNTPELQSYYMACYMLALGLNPDIAR